MSAPPIDPLLPTGPERKGSSTHDGQAIIDAATRRRRRRPPRSRTKATASDPDVPPAPRRRITERETRPTAAMLPQVASAPVLRRWMWFGGIAAVLCLTGVIFALVHSPSRPQAARTVFVFSGNTRALPSETQAWMQSFTYSRDLSRPDAFTLTELFRHLSHQPAVSSVRRIAWEVDQVKGKPVGVLRVELQLRTPVLPIKLTQQIKGWIDKEGKILPQAITPPLGRLPEVRNAATSAAMRLAVAEAFSVVAPLIDPSTISHIDANGKLDERSTGVVFYLRDGCRLLWGHPDEARYGLSNSVKASHLQQFLASGQKLNGLSELNLRYRRPTFRVRD